MSSLQPEHAARWYEDKVRRYGFDHRGLGFRTRTSQEKRFEALLGLGDFHGRRILDVGCGFGDFLAFLVERDIHPLYTGLDVCEPMVDRCQQRFPAGAGRFIAGDVLDHDAFAAANMGVVWQQFRHPQYPQCGTAPFIAGLSALDVLFNCGPAAREIVWQPKVGRDELLAA